MEEGTEDMSDYFSNVHKKHGNKQEISWKSTYPSIYKEEDRAFGAINKEQNNHIKKNSKT